MVYSILDIFTSVFSTRGLVTHSVNLVVRATTPLADILAAELTQLSTLCKGKVAVKNKESDKFGQLL